MLEPQPCRHNWPKAKCFACSNGPVVCKASPLVIIPTSLRRGRLIVLGLGLTAGEVGIVTSDHPVPEPVECKMKGAHFRLGSGTG
jgi:hypothetical protein